MSDAPRKQHSDNGGEATRASGRHCVPTYKSRVTSTGGHRGRGRPLSRLAASSAAVLEMDLEIDEESCPVSEEIVDLDQAGGSTEVDFLSAR
jgi:hypothetical protein